MPLTQKDQEQLLKMVSNAVYHLVRGAHAESLNVAKEMANILEQVKGENEKLAKECEEAMQLFTEKGKSEKLRRVLKTLAPKPKK